MFEGNAFLQLIDRLRGTFISRNEPAIGARVYNSTAIMLATGTATVLTFDSERKNTGGVHSTSANTSRLVCTAAGTYIISGCVEFASNATGRRSVFIFLNGSVSIAGDLRLACTEAGTVTRVAVCTQYDLAIGEYVELYAMQSSGGNLNVQASSNYSPEFSMVRIP